MRNNIAVTRALSTILTAERVNELANEVGVTVHLLDSRLAGKGKWVNDFEISGSPGKVDAFFERFEEVRRD